MLAPPKIPRKLANSLTQYTDLRFERIGAIDCQYFETKEHLKREPKDSSVEWKKAEPGMRWGGSWVTAWFRGDIPVPESGEGRRLWLNFGCEIVEPFYTEALCFVDQKPVGGFDPNHPFILVSESGKKGTNYHCAVEAYSLHNYPGTMPFEKPIVVPDNCREFTGLYLVAERVEVSQFCFDLKILLDAWETLDENSLRRAQILDCLVEVFKILPSMPKDGTESDWLPIVTKARNIMAPILATRNSASAPTMSTVAHSHIDTAWLWPIAETRRKCARTFSTMLNLLDQYPEVIFFQSAPQHADFIRHEYPGIFEAMKEKVKSGQWEPNGAMWVEPDCNIPNGESLVRQTLYGIQWTREHFDYSPDTFWQPDVFGYSAALPQILQGCGVKYFLTTKMAWNDTTRFPFDTFEWVGIDGTTVLAHLNSIPQWMDPIEMMKEWKWAQHKDGQNGRLLSYGYGDGGGGPRHEDMEMVRRMEDFDGLPKAKNTSVSDFMKEVEAGAHKHPRFVGELYLELHRGTLTSLAAIKKGNRRCEVALRNAEFACVLASLKGYSYPKDELREIWKRFLILQFHDILPGTSIQRAHEEAIAAFEELEIEIRQFEKEALSKITTPDNSSHIVINDTGTPVSIVRLCDVDDEQVAALKNHSHQEYESIDGSRTDCYLDSMNLPKHAAINLPDVERDKSSSNEEIQISDDLKTIETDRYAIKFAIDGSIEEFFDKNLKHEFVKENGRLNQFITGEDIPELWDNWDIDEDQEMLMKPDVKCISRKVIKNGPVFLCIRSEYGVTAKSTMTQDMLVYRNHRRIDFHTWVDWNDKHRLLKSKFDFNLLCSTAKHEIQFGYVERQTHRNQLQDRAQFEVSQQRWTEMSENGLGMALINDCKYGVGTKESTLTLSLIKSGTHPDPTSDQGVHEFSYSILPTFDSNNSDVHNNAVEFNNPPRLLPGKLEENLDLISASDGVAVESIKGTESGEGFVVRLYDTKKRHAEIDVTFGLHVTSVGRTNLLEEEETELKLDGQNLKLKIKPFEIITLVCRQ